MTHVEIRNFCRTAPPSKSELRMLSEFLVSSLSDQVGIELVPFKRHAVENESVATTVRGTLLHSGLISVSVEGVVLCQIRSDSPPNISAELMLFSNKNRVGLQNSNGRSYFLANYDYDAPTENNWVSHGWIEDGPDDWERIEVTREADYGAFLETWEDND